jgi:hypothetical protein
MESVHALRPTADSADQHDLAHLVCQSDVEREVLALLRRLDEEDQVGALLILQAVDRRVMFGKGRSQRL